MSPTAESVIEKLDEMLKEDKNFSTRQGARLMNSVYKEGLTVIAEVATNQEAFDERLKSMENSLNTFLSAQKDKQKKDEEERTKWRWALITPTIGLIVAELFRWLAR